MSLEAIQTSHASNNDIKAKRQPELPFEVTIDEATVNNLTYRIFCGIYQRDRQCQESFVCLCRTGVTLTTPRF